MHKFFTKICLLKCVNITIDSYSLMTNWTNSIWKAKLILYLFFAVC